MFFDVIAPTPLIPGTRIFVDWAEIEETFLVVALLTVLIEVPVFYFCGYRKPKELAGVDGETADSAGRRRTGQHTQKGTGNQRRVCGRVAAAR